MMEEENDITIERPKNCLLTLLVSCFNACFYCGINNDHEELIFDKGSFISQSDPLKLSSTPDYLILDQRSFISRSKPPKLSSITEESEPDNPNMNNTNVQSVTAIDADQQLGL